MPRARPRLRAAESVEVTGALGIRIVEYVHEDWQGPQRFVPDLEVRCLDEPIVASAHPASQIYGFLRVPAGPLRFFVTDPEGSYLPRTSAITVHTPGGHDVLPKYETLVVRPGWQRRVAPGATAIRGHVARSAAPHAPIPFARIDVVARPGHGLTPRRYATYADVDGRFLVLLRDLGNVPAEDASGAAVIGIEVDLEARPLRAAVPGEPADPWSVFPDDFDGSSAAWEAAPAHSIQNHPVGLGRITAVPIVIATP
jgi:hypothetical protein